METSWLLYLSGLVETQWVQRVLLLFMLAPAFDEQLVLLELLRSNDLHRRLWHSVRQPLTFASQHLSKSQG